METTTSRAARRMIEGQWEKDARFILADGRQMSDLGRRQLVALARTIRRRKRALEEAETAKRMLMMLGSLIRCLPDDPECKAQLPAEWREWVQDDRADDDIAVLLAELG